MNNSISNQTKDSYTERKEIARVLLGTANDLGFKALIRTLNEGYKFVVEAKATDIVMLNGLEERPFALSMLTSVLLRQEAFPELDTPKAPEPSSEDVQALIKAAHKVASVQQRFDIIPSEMEVAVEEMFSVLERIGGVA